MDSFGCENSCLDCKRNPRGLVPANYAKYHKICEVCSRLIQESVTEKICQYCGSRVVVFRNLQNALSTNPEWKSTSQDTYEENNRGSENSLITGVQDVSLNSDLSSNFSSGPTISNSVIPENYGDPYKNYNKERYGSYSNKSQHLNIIPEGNAISVASPDSFNVYSQNKAGIKCDECKSIEMADIVHQRRCLKYVCNNCMIKGMHSYCGDCKDCFLCKIKPPIGKSYCRHKFCSSCQERIEKLPRCPFCFGEPTFQCRYCFRDTYVLIIGLDFPQCIFCDGVNYYCPICKEIEPGSREFSRHNNCY